MINNDVFRQIRYIFDFNDAKIIEIFGLADHQVTREQVCSWLKAEEDSDFEHFSDTDFAIFLNGLINDKRGRKDGEQPLPESRLGNNAIFRKLKIALDLKSDDILGILDRANFRVSKHELTALFRKSDHKHYRECKDQLLRNFLKGLQLQYRAETER